MELLKTKEKFIELRAKGYSFDKIAKETGKAKQTLVDWSRELQEEIANRKALELEALYEAYSLLVEHRIKSFGSLLSRIREEIERRDFSEIATEKLLELLLKYHNQLREELVEPVYRSSAEVAGDKNEREILDKFSFGLKAD